MDWSIIWTEPAFYWTNNMFSAVKHHSLATCLLPWWDWNSKILRNFIIFTRRPQGHHSSYSMWPHLKPFTAFGFEMAFCLNQIWGKFYVGPHLYENQNARLDKSNDSVLKSTEILRIEQKDRIGCHYMSKVFLPVVKSKSLTSWQFSSTWLFNRHSAYTTV